MHKINSISPLSHDYLSSLRCVDKVPEKLFYSGTLPAKPRPTVAIVGSRKPTSYGREVTQRVADDLAKKGVVVVSGLAHGVDGLAHQATLDAGGTTIAVMAGGLDRIYPASHRGLAQKIIDSGGALLSEYSEGVEPRHYSFLERNRLVSGLADVIIITEAAARSGTLNTAAHALTQGKDVFVVPGNITSPMSAGCNQLLQQGAAPLLKPEDVYAVLGLETDSQPRLRPADLTDVETQILDLIEQGTHDGQAIADQLEYQSSEYNTAMTMLEIKGLITPLGQNRWRAF